jgi:predicted phosphodiesterase
MTFLVANQKYTTPVIKKNQPDDSFKFQNLPDPTGEYPFHLVLDKVVVPGDSDQLTFHMVGDTGSLRSPDFQKLVAGQLEDQFTVQSGQAKPAFLYHLGDVVYNHGELERFEKQFFVPYKNYPAPIFAIPGNHDSDVNPDNPVPYTSLSAFMRVFCTNEAGEVVFSGGSARHSMVQPNMYWVLETPLANIIGLYGNVTKYGIITTQQEQWFIEQLKWSALEHPDKALIVCIHHAPFSADINHGSSEPMIEFFERTYNVTSVRPDVVFSGHVHNYQRFSKKYEDGAEVPFIVAGAGGYDELHAVAEISDDRFTAENSLFEGVKLENFCDTKHGFLKVNLCRMSGGIELTTEYYTIPHEMITEDFTPAMLFDKHSIRITAKQGIR